MLQFNFCVSRFQTVANEEIFNYALHILQYLIATAEYSLVYRSMNDTPIVAFVDASFADAKEANYESTGGHLIFFKW